MEIDSSRLLYLESCEIRLDKLKHENARLNAENSTLKREIKDLRKEDLNGTAPTE